MKLYDAIKIESKFSHYEVQEYEHLGSKVKNVRGKWDVTLSYDGRVMRLPFDNGFRRIHVLHTFFAGPYGIRIKMEQGKKIVDPRDERKVHNVLIYSVEGGKSGDSMALYNSVRPPTPDKQSVLYCIGADIDGLDCSSFEEWADNMGFDKDSRKAEKIYQACLKEASEFRTLMGGQAAAEQVAECARMIDDMTEDRARQAWAEKENPKDVGTLGDRFAELRREANGRLQNAAKDAIKCCPSVASVIAAMGTFVFIRKDGSQFHPVDDPTEDEKVHAEEFVRQGDKFQSMFGPTWGPWKINEDGSIVTDW